MTYCVKCKRQTTDRAGSGHLATTSNGRRQMKSVCATCGSKKCQFVAGGASANTGAVRRGKGTFGNILGSVLGQILPF